MLTGGNGGEQLGEFSARHFIPRMPPDTAIVPVSRTIGDDRLTLLGIQSDPLVSLAYVDLPHRRTRLPAR